MSTNLPALTLETAITKIMTAMPEEGKLIQAMARKDIVALGTDEAFVLRDGKGEIRAFKQSVTFSLAAGTLVQPVSGGPSVISAQGYEVWQEATGASVIFPKEVLVDQQWQPNPAVIRDEHNRRILAIYARAVAFRFSSKGIPQVSDWTTIFDTPSYRLIDLLGKAKKFPQAFKLLPAHMGQPEDNGTWASYPFDESTNLWVNTAHEEALTWFAQILNREKKAIDFAQTFAKRNALKHLSGLQKAPSAGVKTRKWVDKKTNKEHEVNDEIPAKEWTIPVICWRPTSGNIVKWDATTYANLREKVGGLITSGGDEFNAPIETRTGSERTSDEDGHEDLERQVDPEDQSEVIDVESEDQGEGQTVTPLLSESEKLSPEDIKAKANFEETARAFPDEFQQACKELGVPLNYWSQNQAGKVISRVGKILDGGE